MPKDREQIKKLSRKLVENGGSTPLAQLDVALDISEKLEELTQKLEPKEIGDNATFVIKGLKGDKGDKHSDEEVIELIKPLIPEPLKGHDGKDGKDSTVPGPKGDKGDKGDPGKDGRDGVDGIGINGKDGSPDTPDQVMEKVKASQILIPLEKLDGLSTFEKKIKADISVPQTTSLINGKRAKNINFTNATVTYSDDTANVTTTGGGGGGSGDVVGPSGATDNAIARFDTTTGKLIQDSVITIADTTGNMAGVGTINTLTLPTSNFVGLTDSQTLSNKILDQAKIVNSGFLSDNNGNELLIFTTTAAAINELTFANAATGNAPKFTATGGDPNISINFVPKGTGTLQVNGTPVLTSMTVAGSGTELQYRSSATALAALTGSSVSGANLSLAGGLTITPSASTGSPTRPLTVTAPAHTALTASTEFTNINFDLSATQQFATGAKTTQRAMRIQGPTYSAVGATTITSAQTLNIGLPVAGANTTFTNSYGLVVGTPNDFINSMVNFGGPLNSFYQVSAQNTSNGTLASTDYVAQNDTSTNGTNFVDMGITSSGFTDSNFTLWGGASAAYLFSEAQNLTLATMRAGATLRIGTGGTLLANLRAVFEDSQFLLTPGVATTGSPSALSITGAAHTTLTASTEASDVLLSLNRTVQFSTGALTKQTAVRILAPTYSFVGASTISDAATLYINDAPGTGTNATITRKYAIWVDSGVIRGDNEFLGGNGSNTNPTYGFVNDTNTGFYRVAAGRIGIAINGSGKIDTSSTYIGSFTSGGFQIRHSQGNSATVPVYAFFTSTTSGMNMSAANTLNLITNSLTAIEMDSAQKVSIGGQAPVSTLDVRGSLSVAYVAKTANYTATVSDYTINCTSGTFQVTLPTAVGIPGRIYVVVNSGAGTITIGTTSSQTFVNVTGTPTTLTLATLGSYMVQSNGANWMVI